MHGRTLIYAHLSSFWTLEEGDRVYQGDLIGFQGNTGRTENCAPHLHLGGIVGVGYMDGVPSSALVHVHPHLEFDSTNSNIGVLNQPGLAIRDTYKALGFPFGSWTTVGWTSDATGSQQGCLPGSLCRLNVHYYPNAVEGHWGSIQFFRNHNGHGLIGAGRWAPGDAYWVRPNYLGYQLLSEIGMPVMGRVGQNPYVCPASVGCQYYQRFNHGYVWTNGAGVNAAVTCPDVYPAYPNQDYAVFGTDIVEVNMRFGSVDNAAPYEPWPDAWYDAEGNGAIFGQDLSFVVAHFGDYCFPN